MGPGPDFALPAWRARLCICLLAALALGAPPAHAQAGSDFQRGFVLTGWKSDSYLAARSDTALQRMAADGSSHAAVFTQWFMDSATASHLAPDTSRTPSDAAILHAIAAARAAGMAVTVKPQVGSYTGSWIGYAHPADLDAFWADYRTMLLHYADLAQLGGASMLVIGTEMATLSGDEARWRPLIAEVRRHFSGRLTYAANYDEFERVPFWDALDYVGIDAYFALADASDPTPPVDPLAAAWTQRGYLDRIAAVSKRTGRQVLFTEIGYRSIHPTAVNPNLWNAEGDIDTQAQASAYQAFYRAVADQPWMAGVYWWDVNTDEWWIKDYSPIGKPAEQVMAAWNTRPPPQSPAPEPQVTGPPAPDPVAPQAPGITPASSQPPAHAPVIRLSLHGRRLTGSITPYSAACAGRVSLRLRRMSHGRWRYVRSPAPFAPSARGSFHRMLGAGALQVRAVFVSGCHAASSGWVAGA
jgi:hypothetical protein